MKLQIWVEKVVSELHKFDAKKWSLNTGGLLIEEVFRSSLTVHSSSNYSKN